MFEKEAIEASLIFEVDVLLAATRAIQRGLRDVEVAPLDELRQMPVEEREQQRPDVTPVDVGVGHQDDLVVAKLLDVEAPLTDATSECGDERADFRAGEHLVETGPLDVQDLPAQRQDRLKPTVAALLGRPSCAVSLDDVELSLARISRLAVGELARQCRVVQLSLANDLAGLARRLAGLRGEDGLLDDLPCGLRVLLEKLPQLVVDGGLDDRLHFARDQLALRLRVEARVRVLDADDGR